MNPYQETGTYMNEVWGVFLREATRGVKGNKSITADLWHVAGDKHIT